MQLNQFKHNWKELLEKREVLQGFVERKLEIIGEATKQIQTDFKKNYPDVPWKDMAGMRDILIHQYTEVDDDIIWKTITQKIPPLKEHIERIVKEIS